jgi:uncharacterized membrane protein
MIEQSNLPTRRVNISTQKMLGGIGSILILLGWMTGVGILFGIVGVVLWLIGMYQLSNILGKPTIFQKVLIGFILNVAGIVIAFAPWALWDGILGRHMLSTRRDEIRCRYRLGFGFIIGFIVAYPFNVIRFLLL